MGGRRGSIVGVLAALASLWLPGATPSAGQTRATAITVAAASDLQTVLPEVARRFQLDTGVVVKVSLGSSGNFFAQIQNGAPFDVFLSADIDYPRRLVASGHADANGMYEYATGRLVLWTRHDTGIDVSSGLEALRSARVRRIAIANPEHAPYGRAARAAIRDARMDDVVKGRLVLGENISQAAQFVESGNAEVGIIALSLALGPALRKSGTYFLIPSTAHPPIQQAAVVLSATKNGERARQFLAYLKRTDIRQLLERFGFTPPLAQAR